MGPHTLLISALLSTVFAAAGTADPAAAGPAAEELPAQLSLSEAERLFLERGLDLLIAQYGAEGADGDLQAAGAHPNPGVDVTVLYTPATNHDVLYSLQGPAGSAAPRSLWGFSVGLTDNAAISDQLSGKRSLRIEAASKALAAARLNVSDVKRLELGQLREAYTAAVSAALNVVATRESVDTYDKQLALNQKRYDEGALSGLDLSRARQAQLEALQALDVAESGRKQALASLLFLLGARAPTRQEIKLTSGIDRTPLARLGDATVATLYEKALEARTDVKIAVASLEQARVSLRQAKRARVPDIALSLGYSEQCSGTSCSSEPAFSAGVQGNVPLFYRQKGEIRRAESSVAAAERTADKTKAQVLAEVSQALASYVAAKSQVERMDGQLLQQARISRDLAQTMYQKGAASFLDFIEAERQYVASRLEYNQDLAAYWNAVYALETVTGTSFR